MSNHVGTVKVNNLDAAGAVTVASTLTVNSQSVTSDDRVKTNEQNLVNCLNVVNQLSPESYNKTINGKSITEIGFIAQEVESIPELKEAVVTQNFLGIEDYKSLNYNQIFTYNVGATQELFKLVQDLQAKVSLLQGNVEGNVS